MGGGRRLRELMAVPGVLMAAGGPDALTARLIEQVGFAACTLGGAALSMSRGYPDLGLLTLDEVVGAARTIAEAIDIPLIVDADTGFGASINVRRTVRAIERAGAAALHIEDQTWPKRAGHMPGKTVIPAAEMTSKIRAAVASRESADFVVIARCDALAVHGLEDALARGEAYLAAGADVLFFETQNDIADLRAIGARFGARVPLLYNHSESGRVPRLDADELGAMGFKIVAFYGHAHLAAVKAARQTLAAIMATRNSLATWDDMIPLDEFWELCALRDWLAFRKEYPS